MDLCHDRVAPDGFTEISVKGRWISVPSFHVGGNTIVIKGGWIKTAIVHEEDWLETEVEDPDLCVKTLKEQRRRGTCADLFTFVQKLPATIPRHQYPMEWDSVAAIPVRSFKEWWEGVPQETRKNVRRSQKRGVVVSVRELDDKLVAGLVELNNDSPIRQGRHYSHYGKTFAEVKKDQSAFCDRCDLICAYLGDELVGFLKIVYRGEIASILFLLPKASHHDKRPANAMVAKAVELCAAKGISYLTFGKFNYGNKRDSPIHEFKRRNGFSEILVPRYYVPLTTWGRLWMKLGLHRGLLGVLPGSLINILVSARAKWYSFTKSRCSSTPERPT